MSPRDTPAIGVLKRPTRKLSPEPSTTQLTPRSRDASVETSTSMASMITWARRTSSRSTTAISERMAFGGAVMTSALVSTSAQIVTDLSTEPGVAAACAAVAPPSAATAAPDCSFSFAASFSASA
jgi:hypothetical protein